MGLRGKSWDNGSLYKQMQLNNFSLNLSILYVPYDSVKIIISLTNFKKFINNFVIFV